MNESRWWLPSGSTYNRILNVFDTALSDACACCHSDFPAADGDASTTIDFEQLREFRQAQWAKRKLGVVCKQVWFKHSGIASSNETLSLESMVGRDNALCSVDTVFYEYH